MTTRDQIDKKKDELIEILNRMYSEKGGLNYPPSKALANIVNKQRLESELSTLKSQLKEEPEMYPEEFVEWIACKMQKSFMSYGYTEDHEEDLYFLFVGKQFKINELFTLWKDNIKNK